eukprot:6195709-Pleurochrysis_carterae.AAC.2
MPPCGVCKTRKDTTRARRPNSHQTKRMMKVFNSDKCKLQTMSFCGGGGNTGGSSLVMARVGAGKG